jgi:putative tryptophan/tyrosine transport system substrate-binding protein
MRKNIFGLTLWTMLFALCLSAAAQPTKISRIGYLSGGSLSATAVRREAFLQGLRELAYVEGKNILIEWRSSEGKSDRRAGLASELVRLKVDVIVTVGSGDTRAAKEATTTIPIVMIQSGDPVGSGFVASLARPGGTITVLSALYPELGGKALEILRHAVAKLSRVAVLGTSISPTYAALMTEIERAAKAFKLQLEYFDILTMRDIDIAFTAANKRSVQAVLTLGSPVLDSARPHLVDLAIRNRLPGIYPQIEYTEAGGLMSYGANTPEFFRQAPTYVHKILKGANPAELPVQQPAKFELVINLKTAKQIGLIIPPTVLARADRVIK